MPKNNNNKQNIQIAKIETDVVWMKSEIASVRHIVSNDLPHQIAELKKSFYDYRSSQNKWLVGILVTLVQSLGFRKSFALNSI